ncbi:uncharacterized protein LOC110950958 [Acanthochromis polyacanthus]|uniref:uncharacterized protein LOC110950958 n=1 Tax=Acanthochromis polyacanthus TaxID=80966 RepID=UPI002234933A|nr:uncharacterized protein LOC110950958 [Acanthochromis polyacanthus]
MPVVRGRWSLWIYSLIFASVQLWERLSASTSLPPLPPPTLDIYSRSKESVILVCRASEGHHGVVFRLYRFREEVDSRNLQSDADEVQFIVSVKEWYSGQRELYCCLYRNQEGRYSAFSPYLQLEHQTDAAPTHSIPPLPPPVLSVNPSSGSVKRGDTLSFSCAVPTKPAQSQSQFTQPATFLLLKSAEGTGVTSVVPQPQASHVSNPEPQPGVFTVGPVKGGEEGEYTCLYQISRNRALVNSSVSNVVQISITDMLPVPTLVLQQQTDVWHMLCTGSPAYPGAVFSLYLADNKLPVATHNAKVFQHQATFPVPVQDDAVALYQCQYSVLLGRKWSSSERSLPLAVIRGTAPPSSPDSSGVDWPLVLGSFSAVVLFLCSLALVVVVVHRKVKAAAEEKKKRQEAQFWTQVHAKDHIVDLTLRRSSYASQEWDNGDTGTASRSHLWNPLSTFTTPIH